MWKKTHLYNENLLKRTILASPRSLTLGYIEVALYLEYKQIHLGSIILTDLHEIIYPV